MTELFNVFQWFANGTREDVLRDVSANDAVDCAVGLAVSVGARIGTTVEVMITDAEDNCVWHWKRDTGMVWPEQAKGQLKP